MLMIGHLIAVPFVLVAHGIMAVSMGIKAVADGVTETATGLYYKVVEMPPSVFVEICRSGKVSAVKNAINNVDVKNPAYGGAALVEVARMGEYEKNFEILNALIRNGADVNARVVHGKTWTPLLSAVRFDNFEIASKLIEEGADVNVKIEHGNTPLLWLAERVSNDIKKNEMEMMSLLLKNGADVNAANERGETALIIVSKLAAPKFETLWPFSFKKNYETGLLSLLIENGANVNAKDVEGNTALMYVSKYSKLEGGVPFLLEHGANPYIRATDRLCNTSDI